MDNVKILKVELLTLKEVGRSDCLVIGNYIGLYYSWKSHSTAFNTAICTNSEMPLLILFRNYFNVISTLNYIDILKKIDGRFPTFYQARNPYNMIDRGYWAQGCRAISFTYYRAIYIITIFIL